MFKSITFALAFSLISLTVIAQLSVNPKNVNFGKVATGTADSILLTISNTGSIAIQLDALEIMERTGRKLLDGSFSISGYNPNLLIAPGNSLKVWVKFKPIHNIQYQSQLFVLKQNFAGNLAVSLTGSGFYTDSYYDSTFNQFDEALKSKLKTLLAKGYVNLGYNGARDAMYGTIDNHGGEVECVYTGRKATFNTRATATSNNFNCEHTFPQGFFGQSEPMRADIHHLYPTDDAANNKRDNDPFGVVSSPTWQVGGSKWANNVFEPRDQQKGNSARSMMYFVIRYQDYTNFFEPQEAVLRSWHQQFQPTSADIARNSAIYAVQKNRNPFVDHPELEQRILSFVKTGNTAPLDDAKVICSRIDFGNTTGKDTLYGNFILAQKGTAPANISIAESNSKYLVNPLSSTVLPGNAITVPVKFVTAGYQKGQVNDSFSVNYDGKIVWMVYKFNNADQVGIAEPTIQEYLIVNPIYNRIHFSKNLPIGSKIYIRDGIGRTIFFTELNSLLNDIEIPFVQDGCYFVCVNSNQVNFTRRINIVNH